MRESKKWSLFAVILGTYTAVSAVLLKDADIVLVIVFAVLFTTFLIGVAAYLKYTKGDIGELYKEKGFMAIPQPIVLVVGMFLVVVLRLFLVRVMGMSISRDVTLFFLTCIVVLSIIYGIVRQLKATSGEIHD